MKELKVLAGDWQGTLSYKDYTSNKPVSLPVQVNVSENMDDRFLVLSYTYPQEPKANSVDTIFLSANGLRINDRPIVALRQLDSTMTLIVCERRGKDGNDNKPAVIRMSYTIGPEVFVIRKEVRFEDDPGNGWIRRNEYQLSRNAPGKD